MAKKYGRWITAAEASIGEGGQANVFRVSTVEEPARTFALKRLKKASRLNRFRAEIEALAKLNHPNIVSVVEFDLESDPAWYVMPYYPRGPLSRQTESPIEVSLQYFSDVLEGVAAAHSQGITHRDIKPENILVSDQGNAVLSDFGLCYYEEAERHTLSDEVVGPRHFTAPELEEGGVVDVKPSADVYSLGKTLYWLLTRRILPREAYDEPRFMLPREGDDQRHAIWNRFFERSITKDPAKRFADAGEALRRFRELRADWDRCINVPGTPPYRCVFCGTGRYRNPSPDPEAMHLTGRTDVSNRLGLTSAGTSRILTLVCDNCRNVQLFAFDAAGPAMAPQWVAR